jgi:hypothetical protein
MSNPMGRMLVVVEAPHYAASLVIGRRHGETPPGASGVTVLEAAPILRWALGKPWIRVVEYFKRKGFEVTVSPDPAHPAADALR